MFSQLSFPKYTWFHETQPLNDARDLLYELCLVSIRRLDCGMYVGVQLCMTLSVWHCTTLKLSSFFFDLCYIMLCLSRKREHVFR